MPVRGVQNPHTFTLKDGTDSFPPPTPSDRILSARRLPITCHQVCNSEFMTESAIDAKHEDQHDNHSRVELSRIGRSRYKATNGRGGVMVLGAGSDPDFTPVEALLAAIAGCSAIDVDLITGKRAQPIAFNVRSEGDKVRDDDGNHLSNLRITFTVEFPNGEGGDAARAVLDRAIQQSHDRLCTVSRTVQLGSPVVALRADG